MAEIENKIILDVETAPAMNNVAALTDYIKAQKDALKDDTKTFEENQEAVKNLTAAQSKLREVMNTSNMSIQDAVGYRRNEQATYNELVRDLAELTKAYRTSSDAAERSKIGDNIKGVNDKLKEMEAQMGSHKRSVGDYTNSFVAAFSKMGSGASGIINPIKGVTASFATLSATPVVAILGLLANVLAKVMESFKGNEAATNALSSALAPFKIVSEGVAKVTEKLAGWIADVAGKMTNLLIKLKVLKAESEDYRAETEEEIALQQRRREVNEKNAESEVKIAEIRAELADKDAHSAKERLKLAQEWKGEVMEVAKRNKEIAERELALLEKQASHTANSAEMNDKLSEAKVKVSNATRDYNEQLRTCNKAITQINNEIKAEDEAFQKLGKSIKDVDDGIAKQIANTDAAIQKMIDDDFDATMKEAGEIADEFTQTWIDDSLKRMEQDRKEAEARKQAYIDSAYTVAGATSAILGSIADIMENNTDATEEQLNNVKNMRIAGAMIDTIAGAVGAFATAAANPGGIPGMIIGAANAAAITAAGIAQIAQIKSTNISKSSSASGSVSVTAPKITTDVPTTALTTSSSLDEQISSIADRPVVILESDLQSASRRSETKVNETSFK